MVFVAGMNYTIENWLRWDVEVFAFVADFREHFGKIPNVLLANSATFARINMAAHRELIRDGHGETVPDGVYPELQGFVGPDFELTFWTDETLGDGVVNLLCDEEPDGDGHPPE
jgi:hypothetical protein